MTAMALRTALGQRWRSVRASIRGSAIVLTYHRVADAPTDPQLLAIGVEHFAEHVRALSESCNMVSATELLGLMAGGRSLPRRTVVVTFDDGYADTLRFAAPILARHDVPATLFASSDFIDSPREFWWDELERIVLLGDALPSRIEIASASATFLAEQHDAAGPQTTPWDVTHPPSSERQRIYLELSRFMLKLSGPDRLAALESLRAQCGASAAARPTHRPLTADELRELSADGLVEIGAHTRSHQFLSARTPDEQREEIAGSKQALEAICGHEIRAFSYPYGSRDSYSAESERIVREAGFLGAFTTEFGTVTPWMNRFAAPRCPTEDIGGEEFIIRVDQWFRMGR